VKCFPEGVARLKVEDIGTKVAEVVNPRLDTVSREVLRHDEFKDKVKLGRVRDHFICIPGWNIADVNSSFDRKLRDATP